MRQILGAVLGVALAVASSSAFAAELSNGIGESCSGDGTWHFVNNQTGGTQTPGTLTATFVDAHGNTYSQTVNAYKVLQSVQHFTVAASGTLQYASTGNLPGRLVLSDYTCDPKKPEEICDNKIDDDGDGLVDGDDPDCQKKP